MKELISYHLAPLGLPGCHRCRDLEAAVDEHTPRDPRSRLGLPPSPQALPSPASLSTCALRIASCSSSSRVRLAGEGVGKGAGAATGAGVGVGAKAGEGAGAGTGAGTGAAPRGSVAPENFSLRFVALVFT